MLNVATTYDFPATVLPQQTLPLLGLNFAEIDVDQSEFKRGKIVGVLEGVLVLVGDLYGNSMIVKFIPLE